MQMSLRAALLCALVLGAGCASDGAGTGGEAGQEGVVFPPAQFYQVEDHEGNSIDLRDYKGRIVLLNFWATWCGPCRYEIPDLVRMRAEYDPEKVAIIGVSLDQGPAEKVRPLLDRFVRRYEINYPIVLDGEFELIRQYHRRDLSSVAVPMTFVIDQQGRLYRKHVGVPRNSRGKIDPRGALSEDIEALLARS